MSDALIVSLVNAFVTLLGTVVTGIVAYMVARLSKVASATYDLSNSAMGAQKQLLAVTARAKAVITKDDLDVAAANQAEWEYRDHQLRQSVVDAKAGKPPDAPRVITGPAKPAAEGKKPRKK